LDYLAAVFGLAIRSFVGASVREMVIRPTSRTILLMLAWLHPLSWFVGYNNSLTHGSLALVTTTTAIFLMLFGSIKIEDERKEVTPVSRFLLRWFHTYGAVAMAIAIVPLNSLENIFILVSVIVASVILAVFLSEENPTAKGIS
jgi:hypothetical protein